jgi:arylsulfatase
LLRAAVLLAVIATVYGIWLLASERPRALHARRTVLPSDPITFSSGPVPSSRIRASVRGANVVICVIDAARANHIGCYGYERDTTPNIDLLARTSVVFERHNAPYPQTKASTASLFTAQHADVHQAVGAQRMSPDVFTMDQGLREAGYTCALFTSNPWVSTALGLAVTFDVTRIGRRGERGRGGPVWARESEDEIGAAPEDLVAAFKEWLSEGAESPFLAYVHFMPPHHPYVAPPDMEALFAEQAPPGYERGDFPFEEVADVGGPPSHQQPGPELVNLYDSNLRYADDLVQQIVEALAEREVFERTLLIVTSDHGEALGEHGYNWHPACPFDEALHIPLLVRFPRGEPAGRVQALSQTLDVMPTIYEVLGM